METATSPAILEPSGEIVRQPPVATEIAISVEDLSKSYQIGESVGRRKTLREAIMALPSAPWRRLSRIWKPVPDIQTFWALKDVSFEIPRGDVVGIIGRNGAGKSTLLKVLSRITEPTTGQAVIHGRVGSLLEVGTGFHSELTGRENIFLNGAILGMRRAEIQSKFDEIVAFAEIDQFIDTPAKHYSSGMYLRLAFAVAAHLEPEILLVDEVLAVGDVVFQKKCLGKMEDVARTGRTVLFVSHNMGAMRSLCRSGLLLDQGRLVQAGDIGACIEKYFEQVGAFQTETAGALEAKTGSGFGAVVVRGRTGRTVEQSEPFEAETTLTVAQEASGFSLFCIVEDMQGRMVFHLRVESPTVAPHFAGEGRYAVKVALPALWLSCGIYSLYFKVLFWGQSEGARHESDKIPLNVNGSHSSVNATLHPEAAWTVGPRL